jgi:hypothetical protein
VDNQGVDDSINRLECLDFHRWQLAVRGKSLSNDRLLAFRGTTEWTRELAVNRLAHARLVLKGWK